MAYPDEVMRAEFKYSLPNSLLGVNVLHFGKQDLTLADAGDCADLADKLEDWWTNDNFELATNQAQRDNTVSTCRLDEIIVTALAGTPPGQATVAPAITGTIGGNACPNETAVVSTLYTGFVGRSFRGRNFWPGIPAATMDTNGTLQSGTLIQWQATMEALREGLSTEGTYYWVVNSALTSTAVPATAVVVRDVLHHQRRRNT